MESIKVYDRSTRAREPQDCGSVSPTLMSAAGTGGGNDPFVVRFEIKDVKVRMTNSTRTIVSNVGGGKVCPTLLTTDAQSVGTTQDAKVLAIIKF